MHARFRSLAIVAALIGASGCIGATDRAEFDREIQHRGGGVTNEWLSESLDALAVEVGAASPDEVMLLSVDASPGERTVIAVTRRSDRPEFVDTVVIRDRSVIATTPLRDADRLSLDAVTVRTGDLPLDRIEDLTDRALQAFEGEGAYVDQITVTVQARTPTITFHLTSQRRTGTVAFDAGGELVEATR